MIVDSMDKHTKDSTVKLIQEE